MAPAPATRLRKARPSDTEALAAIESRVFSGDRLSPRSLRHAVAAPTAALIVAEADRVVAGYALVFFRAGSSRAWLYSLAVAPEAAGRGLGQALLDAAEKAARARGATSLRLEVATGNRRAIDLYRRNGFATLEHRPAYYEDGSDALRMEKPLASAAPMRRRGRTP